MEKPIIAIVGRPNVGKSTLFNRLLKRRIAIEDDQPGVTRDRLAFDMDWNGIPFTLVDTGGLMTRAQEEMDDLVSQAAEAAIAQADKVVLVMDGQLAITDLDVEITRLVQKYNVPTILAVTKIDTLHQEANAYDYYSLGIEELIPVSGVSGFNAGDLLDKMVEGFEVQEEEEESNAIRLAILGRPNVGKSSLVNKILGEDRQIVSDIPGTTRDAIDHTIKFMKKDIVLVDTAGLMKKAITGRGEAVDYYTSLRTIRAMERCDVAAVLLDSVDGLTQYERRLLDEIRQKGKGLIVVYNKWDLIEKETGTMKAEMDEFRLQLPDLSFVPLLFMSALTGHRARKILDKAVEVHQNLNTRISTSVINEYIDKITQATPPPAIKGRWLKIKYVSQVSVAPPIFTIHLNYPELMPDSYKRFLERKIREKFSFEGVPIKVVFRKK